MRREPSTVPKGGCKYYIDLTNKEDIEQYCSSEIFDVDDNMSINILREFIKWYGNTEIEMNSLEGKYEHFCDVVDFTKFKVEELV